MKEVFRHSKIHRVTRYQDLLEAEGIATFIRNEALSVNEAPIDEFLPNLCVLNDEDYSRAIKFIKDHDARMAEGVETEKVCPSCQEVNPGNFDVCYNCQSDIHTIKPC